MVQKHLRPDAVPIVASALTPTAPDGAFASRPAASASTAADATDTATELVATAGPAPANDQPMRLSTPKRGGEPAFLAQPLLLTGEAKVDYDALLAAVSAKVKSKDISSLFRKCSS